MTDVKGLRATLVYKLGTLGTVAGERFAQRVGELGLKPKHAGLLAALDAGVASSQQELAARLGIVPSLVVALADHLEHLGALQRVRDPQDRRRQVLTLTPEGRQLLGRCVAAAEALDEEFARGLTGAQRATLHKVLQILAAREGLA